jgi:hypothetical protein
MADKKRRLGDLVAIRRYFALPGPGKLEGVKLTMDELRALSPEDGDEMGELCRIEFESD